MKLNPNQNLTRPQISKHEVIHHTEVTRIDPYVHPWYKYQSIWRSTGPKLLKKPNPPTEKDVKKAEFVDKTYRWTKK